ncbi:MAG TPA: glycosyltransferase family 39 protein [Chloroflexia bacterium]|nr:glycosyltransferase family 39 protein [Chloroflexia bacterium]
MATQEFDPTSPTPFEASPAIEGNKPSLATDVAQAASRPSVDVADLAKQALAYLWRGRGLFGGLLAIGLAWLGQQALLAQNDYQTSTRNYILAIIILIISLSHPSWELVQRIRARRVPVEIADGSRVSETPGSDATLATVEQPETAPLSQEVSIAASAEPPLATVPTRKVRSNTTPATPAIEADSTGMAADVTTPVNAQTGTIQSWRRTLSVPGTLWQRWVTLRTSLGWRVTVPGLALTAALAGWSALTLSKDIGSSLGGWLWAASLLALLLTFLGAAGWPRAEGLLPTPASDFFARGLPTLTARWEAPLVAGMMLLAAFLRLDNLEYFPGIFGDEGERGMVARAINEGQPLPLFGVGWWYVPNLYFYTLAGVLRVFGDNMFGDRMLSVISGLLAVWFVYKIGRLLWGPRAGLIAGVMLAISPLALEFSRLAGESTPTGALWAIGFYFLFMALRHRRWSDWMLAGLFWSLSLYFYPSGKLILPLVGVVGLYCLVRWRLEFFKRYFLGFALLGATFALTFMPYAIFSAKDNWQAFSGRAGETSIFSAQHQGATFARYGLSYDTSWSGRTALDNIRTNPGPWAQVIYQQSRETMDALYRRGDQVYYYRLGEMNRPVFSPFWAVLVLLGLAYAAWKVWDARFGLSLLWFALGLAASILTIDTPNLQRFTGAWSVVMLFPAVLIDRVFAAGWPVSKSLARKWATVPIVALLAYLTVISYNEFFTEYRATCPYCRDTVQARYAQALGQDYKGYQMGVGNGYDVYFSYGSTRFAAKGIEGRDMLTPADTLPLIDNNGKGAAFIIYPHNAEYLSLLRVMYPGGIEEPARSDDGNVQFTSYKVPREQVLQSQTVHATYTTPDGATITRDEPVIGTVQSPDSKSTLPPISYPSTATWQGGLVVPTYGAYTLALNGVAADVTLVLDGRTMLTLPALDLVKPPEGERQVELVLAKGLHDIRLSGTLRDANGKLQLQWSSGGPLVPIESRFLYNGPTGGLLGEIGPSLGAEALKSPDPLAGQPRTSRRSDPFIGFREASVLFGGAPYIARWQGTINISAEGDYGFGVNTGGLGPAVVVIDGQTAYGEGPGGPGNGLMHLTPGPHQVDVRYAASGGLSRAEWMWTPPGGQPEIVPSTVLTPLARSWPRSELPDAPVGQLPPPQEVAPDVKKPDLTFGDGLSKPKGIAVDGEGNVYVGDRGNHKIVVYSPDGKKVREWGNPLPEVKEGQPVPEHKGGEFREINDVAVTKDGTVYVFDDTPRVQAFKTSGEYIGTLDPGQLGLYGPNGIAEAVPSKESEGKTLGLYIAVTGQSRVLKLPSVGDVMAGKAMLQNDIESITGTEKDNLEQPVDAVADPSGTGFIYEIDLNRNNERIARLKPTSNTPGPTRVWEISAQWRVPIGKEDGGARLAISQDGKWIYMSDPDRRMVATLNVATGEVSYFGKEGSGEGEFGRPSGIAVGPDGRIYVVDSVRNNVQVFTPTK